MEKKRIALIQNTSDHGMQKFILNDISKLLNEQGYEATVLQFQYFDDKGKFEDFIVQKIEKPDYDLVITMDLTGFERRIMEDETFYNQLYCPMINLMTKDAWYFSHYLEQRLNFSMFFYTLYQHNVDYIRETFWKFPNIDIIPPAGFQSSDCMEYQKRSDAVYLLGDYQNPQCILAKISELPDVFAKIANTLIGRMKQNPRHSLYEELKQYFEEIQFPCQKEELVDILSELSLISTYLEMEQTDLILHTLLAADIPVLVSGRGWGKISEKIVILGNEEYPFEEMLKTMGKTKIVLYNTKGHAGEPGIEAVSALQSGALVLSNGTGYEGMIPFSQKELPLLPEKIRELFTQEGSKTSSSEKSQFSPAILKMVENCFS